VLASHAYDRSTQPIAGTILPAAVAAAILSIPMDNYQWVGWILSGLILAIVLANQVLIPLIWRARMKLCPYTLHFRKDIRSGGDLSELRVPAHSHVTIHFNQKTRTKHYEYRTRLGFHGPEEERPDILEYVNDFVKRGQIKNSDPDTSDTDWIDANNRYTKNTGVSRFRGYNRVFGYTLRTKGPGVFPINFATVTEAGEARPCSKLTLIVEASQEGDATTSGSKKGRRPKPTPAQVRIYGLTFSVAARRLSSCLPLAVRRRCLGCRTVKRVERAWLSNAMPMTHYRRIVNARGTQNWHGNDCKDVRHPTLPHFGVSHAPSHSITHVRGLFHASTENAVSVAGEAQAIGFCPSRSVASLGCGRRRRRTDTRLNHSWAG